MRHQLHIETTFDDGHVRTWDYEQPGSAADAHAALAARWKSAGYTFERDRKALQLTRRIEDEDRGGPYVDVITHADIGGDE